MYDISNIYKTRIKKKILRQDCYWFSSYLISHVLTLKIIVFDFILSCDSYFDFVNV